MGKRTEVVDAALGEQLLTHRDRLAELFSRAQIAIASGDVASLTAIASSASARRARAAMGRHDDL
jgi:hypothetical protein